MALEYSKVSYQKNQKPRLYWLLQPNRGRWMGGMGYAVVNGAYKYHRRSLDVLLIQLLGTATMQKL